MLKPVRVLIDGVEVGQTSAFDTYAFKRWEISIPYLDAGAHEVSFSDFGDTLILIFDDVKIVPESLATGETAVSVANASFEEPLSNINGSGDSWYRPAAADLTGWTAVSVEPSIEFYKQAVTRSWYHAMTNNPCITRGQCVYHEEFPDGFIAMQLYGNGSLSQDVMFPSAGRYRLEFSLARRCGLMPQAVEVRVGGNLVKKIFVRHDEFRKYEAVFDIDTAGSRTVSFAGAVTNAKEYLVGSAFLDGISLWRVSDVPSGNLVANGDFENGATGWTFGGSGSIVSSYSWVDSVQEPPINGTDAMVLGKAASSAEQTVSLAPGRYLLSFRMRGKLRYPERTGTSARFTVSFGDQTLYSANLVDYDREVLMELPFAVATNGSYAIKFDTSSNTSAHMTLVLDDVSVARKDADRVVSESVFGEQMNIVVESGAKLALDYDGTAHVKSVRLAGHRVSGIISAAAYPAYLSGRGMLYVQPRGTCVTFR